MWELEAVWFNWCSKMGLKPLVWYCRPVENGVWAKETESVFGAYTPCALDSVVGCVSHLVLLGLCLYRIWLTKMDYRIQKYRLRLNMYNYLLGLLAGCCAAEPLFRLVMGISLFNLDAQNGLAPFEVCISPQILLLWFLISWFRLNFNQFTLLLHGRLVAGLTNMWI